MWCLNRSCCGCCRCRCSNSRHRCSCCHCFTFLTMLFFACICWFKSHVSSPVKLSRIIHWIQKNMFRAFLQIQASVGPVCNNRKTSLFAFAACRENVTRSDVAAATFLWVVRSLEINWSLSIVSHVRSKTWKSKPKGFLTKRLKPEMIEDESWTESF